MKYFVFHCALVSLGLVLTNNLTASEPPPPDIESMISSGPQKSLRFTPYPGAQTYTIFSATNVAGPFAANTNFFLAPYITGYTTNIITNTAVVVTNFAYEWRLTNVTAASGFFHVAVTPSSSNATLTATVLNRLAYGPTPDELERVTAITPQAYITEQVNMEGVAETSDAYTVQVTNSIPSDATTNWTLINLTGTVSSASSLYLFTTAPGDIYIDDIDVRPYLYFQQIVTNVVNNTTNLVTNRVFSAIAPTNIL